MNNISVDFPVTEINLQTLINDCISIEENSYTLEIKNVSNILAGLQLISQQWFTSIICNHKNLICVTLRINCEIANEFSHETNFFDFELKDSILIIFQSTIGQHLSKAFWKTPERKTFYSIFIEDDESEEITSFFHEILISEIVNGKTGEFIFSIS